MQRSFVSLSPQEALQVAISIEDRNAELYHSFAELFTEFGDEESLDIAAVFWEYEEEVDVMDRSADPLLRLVNLRSAPPCAVPSGCGARSP